MSSHIWFKEFDAMQPYIIRCQQERQIEIWKVYNYNNKTNNPIKKALQEKGFTRTTFFATT